ncbi:MAG TPA: hypothetical protein VMX75_03250 [Spirochaetia bacterium]|nr:hypothetical protein [Spirochaetia bacterium]
MSLYVTDRYLSLAEKLVSRTLSAGGMAPVDLDRFWADQQGALSDPWAEDCPQVPLGIFMSQECVFAELGVKEDWYRLAHDEVYRIGLNRAYNDRAERIVGCRLPLFEETACAETHRWPEIKPLHEIFDGRQSWKHSTFWLEQSIHTPEELEACLDRAERRLENLRAFLLPDSWDEEKRRLIAGRARKSLAHPLGPWFFYAQVRMALRSCRPPLYRQQRGPVTMAASLLGVENLVLLINDHLDLAARFRDLILRGMLERARIIDEELGYTPETAPRGFDFNDDGCMFLNPEMYAFFGYPILKGVFEVYSPGPDDLRSQHSDSEMAHLLPLLGRLNLTSVNFGPTLRVDQIRDHLPHAVIHGQLAPLVFSRNEEVNMVSEFLRDFEQAREKRGLVFNTAGVINNGSRLSGLRLILAAIQEYGRYDR